MAGSHRPIAPASASAWLSLLSFVAVLGCGGGSMRAADGGAGGIAGSASGGAAGVGGMDGDTGGAAGIGGAAGGAAGTAGAGGQTDAGADANPECPGLANLVLSPPQIVAGRLSPGGTATLQMMLTNASDVSYTRYPGAIIETTTAGISFVTDQSTVALLAGQETRPLSWSVAVAASVSAGTDAQFSAHVIGGGALDCPNASAVPFTLPVESP